MITILLLLSLFHGSVLADVVQIILPEELVVEKKEIFLKDVAFISGGEASLQELIGEISLGMSPLPGNPRIITRQSILLRLEREGIDLLSVHVESPERMEIQSLFPFIQTRWLEEVLQDYLLEDIDMDLGWLEIEYLQGADETYYPQGDLEILLARDIGGPSRYLGETTIPMEVFVDGERWRQIYPRFSIEIMTLIPVLKKSLNRNQIITEDLIEIKMFGLSQLPKDYVFDEEEVFGMRLLRNIEAGVPLRMSYLEEIPLVERGDRVTIQVILGSMTISLLGEARGTGLFGDVIQVRNLDSNKLLHCKIIGPKLVQIEVGGM